MPIALLVASSKSKIPNEPKINSYGKLKLKKSNLASIPCLYINPS